MRRYRRARRAPSRMRLGRSGKTSTFRRGLDHRGPARAIDRTRRAAAEDPRIPIQNGSALRGVSGGAEVLPSSLERAESLHRLHGERSEECFHAHACETVMGPIVLARALRRPAFVEVELADAVRSQPVPPTSCSASRSAPRGPTTMDPLLPSGQALPRVALRPAGRTPDRARCCTEVPERFPSRE